MVHTRLHVYEIIYLYVHDTVASEQLHNHISLPIRPNQPCDAGESQLHTGASPSEQPPFCHMSPALTDHPSAACLVQTATATGLPHKHCCSAGNPLLHCHRCPQASQPSCAGCTCEESSYTSLQCCSILHFAASCGDRDRQLA